MVGHERAAPRDAAGAAADESDAAAQPARARARVRAALRRPRRGCWRERGALDSGDLVLRDVPAAARAPARARARGGAAPATCWSTSYQEATFAQATLLGPAVRGARQVTRDDEPGAAGRRAGENFRRELPARVPEATVVSWSESRRCPAAVLAAAARGGWAQPGPERPRGRRACASGAAPPSAPRRRPWRAECERLVAGGAAPDAIAVLVRSAGGRRHGGRRARWRSARCPSA